MTLGAKRKTLAAVALLGLWGRPASADLPIDPPPPQGLNLRARLDLAAGYGKSRGLWRRSLVVGAIWGSQSELRYYTYGAALDLPSYDWAFRIGSVTKTMTATLLALQEGQGMRVGACSARQVQKTLLRDKLAQACPTCEPLPGPRWDITIEQLATHGSGLPKRPTSDACNVQQLYKALDVCDVVSNDPPDGCVEGKAPYGDEAPDSDEDCDDIASSCVCNTPGEAYHYSNWAFATLGHLLADNAGCSSWRELDRMKILDPLGMTHTRVDSESFAGLHQAPFTSCTAAGCADVADPPYPAVKNPGGGLWSTGPDMMKYLLFAMGRPHYMQGPGVDALYAARDLIFCRRAVGSNNYDQSPGWMGLGWNQNYLGPAGSGAPATGNPDDLIWWKGGDIPSHHAYIAISPARNAGVFVLSNTDPDGTDEIARHVLRSFWPVD